MQKYFLFAFAVLFTLVSHAQVPVADSIGWSSRKNAFEKISMRSHASEGVVQFHQDARIEKIVVENSSVLNTEVQGYRVQVFSSNAHRTAKEEAFKLEQRLTQVFPDHKVYVSYTSPFWKVRIGDFYTRKPPVHSWMCYWGLSLPRKETYSERSHYSFRITTKWIQSTSINPSYSIRKRPLKLPDITKKFSN